MQKYPGKRNLEDKDHKARQAASPTHKTALEALPRAVFSPLLPENARGWEDR